MGFENLYELNKFAPNKLAVLKMMLHSTVAYENSKITKMITN
jgi:hypothetical protein